MPKAMILVFLEGNKRPAKVEIDEGVVATIVSPLATNFVREGAVFGQAVIACLQALDKEVHAPAAAAQDTVADGAAEQAPLSSDDVQTPPADTTPSAGLDELRLA